MTYAQDNVAITVTCEKCHDIRSIGDGQQDYMFAGQAEE